MLKGGWIVGNFSDTFSNFISPKGKYIATYHIIDDIGKKEIMIWDSEGNKIGSIDYSIYTSHGNPENRWHHTKIVKFNFQEDKLVVVDQTNKGSYISLWDIHGNPIKILNKQGLLFPKENEFVKDVYFSEDGQKLIINYSQDKRSRIKEIDIENRKLFTGLRNIISLYLPSYKTFHRKYFMIQREKYVLVLNKNHIPIGVLRHIYPIKEVKFSSDSEKIATLAEDNKVRIWTPRGEQIAEFDGSSMSFNDDWSQILVTDPKENALKVWRLDDLEGLLARGCDWLKFDLDELNRELRQYCQSLTN